MPKEVDRTPKIAIYTWHGGKLWRTTSHLTESKYLMVWNVEYHDLVGADWHKWSIDEGKIVEMTGWPERHVRWYGDEFGIAPIATTIEDAKE